MAYNNPEIIMAHSYTANKQSFWYILESLIEVLLLLLPLAHPFFFDATTAFTLEKQNLHANPLCIHATVFIDDTKAGMNNATNGQTHKVSSGSVTDVKIKKDASFCTNIVKFWENDAKEEQCQ